VFSINFSVTNTPDKLSGLISSFWEYKETVIDEEHRYKIFIAENEADFEIQHLMLAFSFNMCHFLRGTQQNLVARVLAENFFDALNSNDSCPMLKGSKRSVIDMKLTDNFLPPVRDKTRFRAEIQGLVKLKGQKKVMKVYLAQFYFTIKK
jgi:Protein of unknown function (DUF1091)